MWSYTSFIALVSICVVLGTIFITCQKYNIDKSIEKKANDSGKVRSEFLLSPDKISGPIVVPFKTTGNRAILMPKCLQPLHHGVQNCTNTSSLRFYVDGDTLAILAFKYSGCGGNSNNFKTFDDTLQCFPVDWSQCPISSAPINNLNSNSSFCGTLEHPECTGPNAYCSRGAFIGGQCCDKTIRDNERNDVSRKTGCSAGSKKVAFDSPSGFTITLLGKTCESNFCPRKSTCHQGNYFAYCCEVY